MTTTTTRVRLAPPPPALMRMINPLVRRVLTNPRLGRRLTAQALLEFTGRRSGKTIRVPVCAHLIDGAPAVFTARPWRLNFTDPARITVTQQGRVRRGHAVLLPATPRQVAAALRTALDNGATPFQLGLKVSGSYEPTIADLAAVAPSLIRIDYDV